MENEFDLAAQHPCDLPVKVLLSSCQVTRTRGTGPGGQHRNKVETAIVITHEPTGVSGQASEKRSQQANKEVAIARLRTNLALAIRIERQTCSSLWRLRTRQGRLQINMKHLDYASILAEAMDFVWMHKFDVAAAARRTGISTSQLIKFLKTSAAFAAINRQRQQLDLSPLK